MNDNKKLSCIAVYKVKRSMITQMTRRSSHLKCSVKKGVPRNFAKFTGKHLCQIPFLIKMQVSGTGVFLWILQIFYEHLFYRAPLGDCFYDCRKMIWTACKTFCTPKLTRVSFIDIIKIFRQFLTHLETNLILENQC